MTASSNTFFKFSPVRAEHSTNLAAPIVLDNFNPSLVVIFKSENHEFCEGDLISYTTYEFISSCPFINFRGH